MRLHSFPIASFQKPQQPKTNATQFGTVATQDRFESLDPDVAKLFDFKGLGMTYTIPYGEGDQNRPYDHKARVKITANQSYPNQELQGFEVEIFPPERDQEDQC